MRSFIVFLGLLACANAFRFIPVQTKVFVSVSQGISRTIVRMSDEPNTKIIPVDKGNIESAAAVTGGILGLVLGGPILAALFAAITNYVAKKENESGEAIRGVGKTVVESVNFLTKLNAKYNLSGKVGESVTKAVSNVEKDSDVVSTVSTTVTSAVSKLDELNKEFDLLNKGKEIAIAAGTLSDAALDKLIELNAKYDFVETSKTAATKVVAKVQETAAKTTTSE
eukprot:gene7916-10746_t